MIVGGIINEKVGRKLQEVKVVEGYNRVKISPSSEETSLMYVGGIISEEVRKKLQRVKTVQRYNWVKISPRIQRRKS